MHPLRGWYLFAGRKDMLMPQQHCGAQNQDPAQNDANKTRADRHAVGAGGSCSDSGRT